jgi:hypothetical protein
MYVLILLVRYFLKINMEYIYLPVENVNDFKCYAVYDKDTIRAYYTIPSYNSSSEYIDFYINSHYLMKEGRQTWGQSSYTSLPNCLPTESITNSKEYSIDYKDNLILGLLILFIYIYIPFKLTYLRLFRRFNP